MEYANEAPACASAKYLLRNSTRTKDTSAQRAFLSEDVLDAMAKAYLPEKGYCGKDFLRAPATVTTH